MKKYQALGHTVEIRPAQGWFSFRLHELWQYRELFYFLTWRDIKVRYKQTILGATWAILQPLLTMIVFSLFFGKLAQVPSDNVPYPLFSFVALVPWNLFANGFNQASNSLVLNTNLVKKVYFPRVVIPFASVFSNVVDFLIAFIVLLLMMLGYQTLPTFGGMLFLPVVILLTLLTVSGVSLWLAALNVKYRDVRYTIPFLTQLWLFATPIAYPSSLVPEFWRSFYALNPMVGVIEGFRWSLLGTTPYPGVVIMISYLAALVLFASGFVYFQKVERKFADFI